MLDETNKNRQARRAKGANSAGGACDPRGRQEPAFAKAKPVNEAAAL
jgi:hypothetical protein